MEELTYLQCLIFPLRDGVFHLFIFFHMALQSSVTFFFEICLFLARITPRICCSGNWSLCSCAEGLDDQFPTFIDPTFLRQRLNRGGEEQVFLPTRGHSFTDH